MIQKILQKYGYYIPEEEILKAKVSYNIHFEGQEILNKKSVSWTNSFNDMTNINEMK